MRWVLPLFGLVLLLTFVQSRRPVPGGAWQLLRCLFPSWRFFEDVEPGPELTFRVAAPPEPYGAWLAAIPETATWPALLLNASGNLRLAKQSLVEQLHAELDGKTVDAARSLVSYRLVQRLVEARARELGATLPARYVFRLSTSDEVDFESEEHAL